MTTKKLQDMSADELVNAVECNIAAFNRNGCSETLAMLAMIKSQAAEIARFKEQIKIAVDEHVVRLINVGGFFKL
tara:strand:- start:56 stop:280 length:225 start_codon:yes stop_codon:yes gene_type:complete